MAAIRHHRDGCRGQAGRGRRSRPRPSRPRSLEVVRNTPGPVGPGVLCFRMDRIWQWAWDRYGPRYSWAPAPVPLRRASPARAVRDPASYLASPIKLHDYAVGVMGAFGPGQPVGYLHVVHSAGRVQPHPVDGASPALLGRAPTLTPSGGRRRRRRPRCQAGGPRSSVDEVRSGPRLLTKHLARTRPLQFSRTQALMARTGTRCAANCDSR